MYSTAVPTLGKGTAHTGRCKLHLITGVQRLSLGQSERFTRTRYLRISSPKATEGIVITIRRAPQKDCMFCMLNVLYVCNASTTTRTYNKTWSHCNRGQGLEFWKGEQFVCLWFVFPKFYWFLSLSLWQHTATPLKSTAGKILYPKGTMQENVGQVRCTVFYRAHNMR